MEPQTPEQNSPGQEFSTYDRRPTVVLAGSSEEIRQMLRTMLEAWGLDVTVAGSCSESPEVAGRVRPDLVMLDAAIPFTESLEAAAELKNQPPTADIPVLMISDFAQPPFREAALAQGVADYITKPCSLEHLHGTVLNLIQRRHIPYTPQRSHHNRPRIRPNSVL